MRRRVESSWKDGNLARLNAGAEQNEDCCPGLHTWLVMNGAANPNGASAHILGGEMGVIDVIAGTWGMFIHPVETVKGTLLLFSPMDITSKIQLTLSLGSAYQAVVQGNGFERGRVFGNILGTVAMGALGEVRVLGLGRGVGVLGAEMEFAELSSLNPTHYITKSESVMKTFVSGVKVDGAINESILFVEHNGSKFIVDGHHRFFAAQKLGFNNVPVKQVQLPYGGYQTAWDLTLTGKQPGWWKYYKP